MSLSKCDLRAAGRALTAAAAVALATGAAQAIQLPPPPASQPGKTLILDGSFVHDAGNVGLNITNWGLLGSHPGLGAAYSDAPSLDSPPYSGINHLWGAGLWIGALQGGVPRVTTGQFQIELAAEPDDALDTIYRSVEGAPGDRRYPDPAADDDADGAEDEDPPNGRDDDLDGAIDEDYGAIGQQDFRCVMRDDSSALLELHHVPMHLEVVQTSHAWTAYPGNSAVAFDFVITNRGTAPLEAAYLGMLADFDIGESASDDLPGLSRSRVRAGNGEFLPLELAFGYDADGDNGSASRYCGVLLLDHSTDPTGETAPLRVRAHGMRRFQGSARFGSGGDPTNDSERYQALAEAGLDPVPTDPGKADDYRVLVSVGPFGTIAPQASVRFSVAFVLAEGLDGLRRLGADMLLFHHGRWYDRDQDPSTGIKGRERRVCLSDFGPAGPGNPLFTLYQDCVTPEDPTPPLPIAPEDLDEHGCLWINADCDAELAAGAADCTRDGEGATPAELVGCTGVRGHETLVHWMEGGGSVPTPRGELAAELRGSAVTLQAGVDLLWPGGLRVDRLASATVVARSWPLSEAAWSGSNASRFTAGLIDDDPTGWPRRYALVLQNPLGDVVLAEVSASLGAATRLALVASPNPFNPRTTLLLTLTERQQVELIVHDARGRRVRSMHVGTLPAGTHPLVWDGRDDHGIPAASGVYVARATAGARAVTRSLTLVR